MSEFNDFLKNNENVSESKIFDGDRYFDFQSDEDVRNLAREIARNQVSQDPFWDDMAEILLKSLLYYVAALYEPEKQNLNSCLKLVEDNIASIDKGRYFTDLVNCFPFDHPARAFYKSIDILPDKTYLSVFKVVQEKLINVMQKS